MSVGGSGRRWRGRALQAGGQAEAEGGVRSPPSCRDPQRGHFGSFLAASWPAPSPPGPGIAVTKPRHLSSNSPQALRLLPSRPPAASPPSRRPPLLPPARSCSLQAAGGTPRRGPLGPVCLPCPFLLIWALCVPLRSSTYICLTLHRNQLILFVE